MWLDQISAIAAALGLGRLVCWRLCVPRGWITASLSRKQRLLWLHEIAVRVRAPFNRSRVCVGLTEGGSPKMGSQAYSTIAEGREGQRGTLVLPRERWLSMEAGEAASEADGALVHPASGEREMGVDDC